MSLSWQQHRARKIEIHKEVFRLDKLMEQIKVNGDFDDYIQAWNSREKLYEELIQLDISFWELDND